LKFDKSKGFCNGLYVHNGGCEVTFHSLKHTNSEVAIKNCKNSNRILEGLRFLRVL
jgi:predicted transcriptional regulator YheO